MKPIIYKHRPVLKGKYKFIDVYTGSLRELFFLENPALKKSMPEIEEKLKAYLNKRRLADLWIRYPDKKILVRTVSEKIYFRLRTARNRNIINSQEQKNYRQLKVGVAGLSVGSAIVSSLVVSGGPKVLKIADFDSIELTNLNRLRASLLDIGRNKTSVSAEQIWALDPFAQLTLFEKGLTASNLKKFLLALPKLDVFIDEMDNIPLKIQARLICKKNKIPVIMATDNGDGILLDVERFDLEPRRKIFFGKLSEQEIQSSQNLSYQEWIDLAIKILDFNQLSKRIKTSLKEIGKSIPAIPQLGTTANLAGTAVSLALRKIANKQSLPSGRYNISLDNNL